MDLSEFVGRVEDSEANESSVESDVYSGFIYRRPSIAVPYLVILSMAIFLGTSGNLLIISTVLLSKVGILFTMSGVKNVPESEYNKSLSHN
jgi:hypothetical protein